MDTTFLTAVDIARILRISKALAYRLIAKGEIASIRFGKTVRVRQEDLETFLSRKVFPSSSSAVVLPRSGSSRNKKG